MLADQHQALYRGFAQTPLDWGHFGELNSSRAAGASASFWAFRSIRWAFNSARFWRSALIFSSQPSSQQPYARQLISFSSRVNA